MDRRLFWSWHSRYTDEINALPQLHRRRLGATASRTADWSKEGSTVTESFQPERKRPPASAVNPRYQTSSLRDKPRRRRCAAACRTLLNYQLSVGSNVPVTSALSSRIQRLHTAELRTFAMVCLTWRAYRWVRRVAWYDYWRYSHVSVIFSVLTCSHFVLQTTAYYQTDEGCPAISDQGYYLGNGAR